MDKNLFQATVPVDLEVPAEMSDTVAEIFAGRYEAPFAGQALTILDIGANVGAFTVWANLRWPGSHIHSYEPDPATYEILSRNVRGLSNVTCANVAVYCSQRQREPFHSRYAGDGEAGLAHVVSRFLAHVPPENIVEVPVLDPRRLPRADIVKIDTEGAELNILDNMDLREVSLILLEYHSASDAERLKQLLAPDFDLEYEDSYEWRPLLTNGVYRPSLAGDCYGQLCFVNRHRCRLTRTTPTVDSERAAPGPEQPPMPMEVKSESPARRAPVPEARSADAPRKAALTRAAPALTRAAPAPAGAAGRSLRGHYDLLHTLVVRDMQLRYKRSILGIAWSLLNPLAQLFVFGFIFRFVLPLDIPNYTVFLFIGILAWTWFQSALHQATVSIVENGTLVSHPGFPVAVLPVVTVSSHLVHFLIALPIAIVFMLLTGVALTPAILALPLVIALQFVLSLSLAYLLATVHVAFRDTQHLLGIVLLLGFFLTPIFYEFSAVPPAYRPFFELNPMKHLVEAYRTLLLQGQLPEAVPLLVLAAISLVLLLVGYRVFRAASYRFVEQI